jgi:hypothetical protein
MLKEVVTRVGGFGDAISAGGRMRLSGKVSAARTECTIYSTNLRLLANCKWIAQDIEPASVI